MNIFCSAAGLKEELDSLSTWVRGENGRFSCSVLKSEVADSVWYGACRYSDTAAGISYVFAAVIPAEKIRNGYRIRIYTEEDRPSYCRCPSEILDLLSGNETYEAGAWRSECRSYHQRCREKQTERLELARCSRQHTAAVQTVMDFGR